MTNRQDINLNDPRWTVNGPNTLSEENLKRVKAAFEEGWVCGIHLYYAGGCGGDPIAFSAYQAYLVHVLQSRPGDLFYLWSVPEMKRRNLLLVEVRHERAEQEANSLLSPECLSRLRQYL